MAPTLRLLASACLVLFALLAFAPSAAACHAAPEPTADDACTDWDNPPFGVVPFATQCAGAALSDGVDACNYGAEIVDEVLFGCPPTGSVASCSIK